MGPTEMQPREKEFLNSSQSRAQQDPGAQSVCEKRPIGFASQLQPEVAGF